MKRIVLYLILLTTSGIFAQEKLDLKECYRLVEENYPLAKQQEILENQNQLELKSIEAGKLPKAELEAQATYQSEVIEIPLPNSPVEPLNKDQYRATLTVNQLIYGAGIIDAKAEASTAAARADKKQVEVNLYQLKKRVNQLFFSILLVQEKKELLKAKKQQLDAKFEEVQSGVKNGVLLPSSDKVLKAEILKIGQDLTGLEMTRARLLKTLATLTDKNFSKETILEEPQLFPAEEKEMHRPELELFSLQKEVVDANAALLSKETAPKLAGFATGGYGNPGLNMLDNSFQPFYIAGLKLNWNILDWNANKKRREALAMKKDIIENEAEVFELNTNIELEEQRSEMDKYRGFLASDEEMVGLRKEIVTAAESQLRNGVITSSEYITELTNLYEASSRLKTHQLQLKLAIADFNIIKGEKR
ncbi:MAG: TolC family protein [Salegentibacter sp.]